MADEFFDVVDDQDRVLRRETRAEVHRQRLFHRAVHVLLFNSRGEVYLQQRSAQKDTYPGRWTTSCSGHVDAGEDYETAVVRELKEELDLQLGAQNVKLEISPDSREPQTVNRQLIPVMKYSPCRATGWEFIWIYTLTTDTPPAPDPNEISEGRWLPPADLDAWLAREPKAFTPSFILVWNLWKEKNQNTLP